MTTTALVSSDELTRESLKISGEAFHHLFRAARLRVGERLRLTDGRGGSRWSVVGRVERHSAFLTLENEAPSNDPDLAVELVIAPPKASRASWMVEKGTELGVRAFHFFKCERTSREFGAANLDRLRRVARSALEQSNGSWLPEVTGMHSLEQVIADLRASPHLFVLDPESPPSGGKESGGGVCVVIGPEGGLTPAELKMLIEGGFESWGLGPRVLRVETAAIAAAAALLVGA